MINKVDQRKLESMIGEALIRKHPNMSPQQKAIYRMPMEELKMLAESEMSLEEKERLKDAVDKVVKSSFHHKKKAS